MLKNITSTSIRSLCSLGQPKAVLRTFLVANYANRYKAMKYE